jgi:hypothetical protein
MADNKTKMLKELASKHLSLDPPDKDEFVTYDWCEATGLSHAQADRVLKRMVGLGDLTSRKGRVNGRSGNIYKPV